MLNVVAAGRVHTINCANCSSENPDGKQYCGDCGAGLGGKCPSCGAEVLAGKKFCADCGASLSQGRNAGILALGSVESGERRHLTVLFCDLVDSTSIAARLDPEEWRDITAEYQRATSQVIESFGGRVAKYLGDGVMAFFGYPQAHDNDAQRAVSSGLAILGAIASLKGAPNLPALRARIGIHSGPVVVGETGHGLDVFGDTPNVASRVQNAAEAGTVLVTGEVHRLVSGMFVVEPSGPQTLKGVVAPVELFRVVRPSGVRGRLAASRSLTPFVGRQDELHLLIDRWGRACEGLGQAVLLIGEAGIGKSRLVRQFHEQVTNTPHTWIECAGDQLAQNTPLYPVTEMLRQWLGVTGEQSEEQQVQLLARRLELMGINLENAMPLLAPILNLPVPAKYPPILASPQEQRRRLLAEIVQLAMTAARTQPTIIVLEDLHWVDPSTLELQQLLLEQGAMVPLLVICTARPEFRPPWSLRAHHAQITLSRLNSHDAREMVGLLAMRDRPSQETVETLVERSSGVPLFVEELTRLVLEKSGSRAVSEIPSTLHDSLLARLDRLGSAKEIAQIAAVIGHDFSYRLIRAVAPISESKLQSGLQKLSDAELLYVQGLAPDAVYAFKHALIQDAAYGGLLKSLRRQLHRTVAHVMKEEFGQTGDDRPELLAKLAHHYTEAGMTLEAISYWQKAGNKAAQRSAGYEAISHLSQGLALLEILPDAPQRQQIELVLQTALGSVLVTTKGYAATEVESAYARARDLCRQMGNNAQLFPVLVGLCFFYMVRGRLREARALGEELLSIAEQERDIALILEAKSTLGITLFYLGEFAKAREHLEECSELYDFDRHHSLALTYVHDPGTFSLGGCAWALWFLGYPDLALEKYARCLDLARRLPRPFNLANVLFVGSSLYEFRRESHRALTEAEENIRLCEEQGFPFWGATTRVVCGRALVERGESNKGIAEMKAGIAAYETIGSALGTSYLIALLAEAYEKLGMVDDALKLLDGALATVEKHSERFYEAEIHRLRGELLTRLSPNDSYSPSAEEEIRCALTTARSQGAKSLELRAAMSLSRLLMHQGNKDAARTVLSEVYSGFVEGFSTPDLRGAKLLLETLNA